MTDIDEWLGQDSPKVYRTAADPVRRPLLRRRWVQVVLAGSMTLAGLGWAGSVLSSPRSGAVPAMSGAAATRMPLAVAAAPKAATAQPAPGSAALGAPAPDGAPSRIVKTGTIALAVADGQVSPTLNAVQRAAALESGYVSSSSSQESGPNPSGELTLRVPVDHFERLVDRVRNLHATVLSATTSGQDATSQYVDLQAQLRTLRATRDRFLAILSQTKTISEILTVQQRVDDVSGQIDRVEGQRRLLASQSDLSTLTVDVSQRGDPVLAAQGAPPGGMTQALRDAKDGFVSGVEGIVRHSGGALLLLICVALAWGIGRLAWRFARRSLL